MTSTQYWFTWSGSGPFNVSFYGPAIAGSIIYLAALIIYLIIPVIMIMCAAFLGDQP